MKKSIIKAKNGRWRQSTYLRSGFKKEIRFIMEAVRMRAKKTMKKIFNSLKIWNPRNPRNNKRIRGTMSGRHLLINQRVKNVYKRRVDHNFNENKRAFC